MISSPPLLWERVAPSTLATKRSGTINTPETIRGAEVSLTLVSSFQALILPIVINPV
ncbi:hypothetical protein D3C76_1787340 [compost metagenome]